MLVTELVTAPTDYPVNVAELSAHLRETTGTEDKYLEALIHVATDIAEKITRRALITQTHKLYLDELPSATIELPFGRAQSVTHFKYYDWATSTLTTWAATNYYVDTKSEPARLVRKQDISWPTLEARPSAVEIQFVAGYGNRDAVPLAIKQAILIMCAHWYENREPVNIGSSVSVIPMTAEYLLWPFRVLNDG